MAPSFVSPRVPVSHAPAPHRALGAVLACFVLAGCAEEQGAFRRAQTVDTAGADDSASRDTSTSDPADSGVTQDSGTSGGGGGGPDTAPPPDADGDGTPDAADCAPTDAAVHPGAAEVCDGRDNDCDGGGDPGAPPSCPGVPGLTEGGGLIPLDASNFVLSDERGWDAAYAILAGLERTLPRVSVADVFADGNRDGDVLSASELSRATGFARGFAWNSGDTDVDYWMPQGVTGTFDADPSGRVGGRAGVLVSWHYDPADAGTSYDKGVRVSLADVTSTSTVTYRHLLLVAPTGSEASPNFQSVNIHAGGIAWVGHYLYVADTSNGLRVFDMDHILRVDTTHDDRIGCSGGVCEAYSYKYVIPQVNRYSLPACGCDTSFSFVALDRSTTPMSLVTGTYDSDSIDKFVLRWPLDDASGRMAAPYTHATEGYFAQQDRMQGAVSYGGAWWLSCSSQSGSNGKLYRVGVGSSTGYTWVYGPEDLAVDAPNGWLWSATEHPGDRAVFAVRASSVGG